MQPEVDGLDVQELIGRGAFSTVYRAVESAFGRTVAVKIVDIDPGDVERQRRFERECILIGRLAAHPNVVSVFSQGVTDTGRPYLVMELCPAGSLRAAVTRRGQLDPNEVLEIGVALAGALETAHLEGVLHRDLKPENILIGTDGAPKVGDFGIATLAAGATATTTTAMTPVHAAPELFEGRPASIRSDVYSLGSTLFTLLEGRPPITLELGELASFVARAAREPRPRVGVRVPSGLSSLIAELLSLDPLRRPATMAEIGERMRTIQASLGEQRSPMVVIQPATETVDVGPETGPASTTEEPDGLAVPATPPPVAHRRRFIGVAAAVALLAAAFGGGMWAAGGSADADAGAPTTTVAPNARPDTADVVLPGLEDVDVDWVSPRASGEVTDEVLTVHDSSLERDESIPLVVTSELRLALDAEMAATPVELRLEIPQAPVNNPYDYPVRLVMDYINPVSFGSGACRGFKSSLLGMIDGRYLIFDNVTVLLTVELENAAQARQVFLGTAMQLGLEPDQCTGFDDDGWPTDRDDMSVSRNDFGFDMPDGLDDLVSGTTTDRAYGVIVRRGNVVTYVRVPATDGSDPVAELTPYLTAVAKSMDAHIPS